MNEELTPQKERFLREMEQKLRRRELDEGCWTTVCSTSDGVRSCSARLTETASSVSDQRISQGRK